MKKPYLKSVVAAGLASFLAITGLHAQNLGWHTVDDFQLVPGSTSVGYGIGVDPASAHIFSAGYAYFNSAGNGPAIINATADAGQTWTTMDQFTLPGGSSAAFRTFTADPSGQLYAGGSAKDSDGVLHWVVRKSKDGALTWSTDDLFQNATGTSAQCTGLKADATGNVYACGVATDETNVGVWTVRRRDAGTGGWGVVDTLGSASGPSFVRALAVHPQYGLFVVGYANNAGTMTWTVRRSSDGINSWHTVDSFATTKKGAVAAGIAVDGSGAIYVVGSAYSGRASLITSWVVRRSLDGGATWSTIDTFCYNGWPSSSPTAVTLDTVGNLCIVGSATPSSGASHWLLRKGTPANGSFSWSISDDFQLAPRNNAGAYALTLYGSGSLLVTGWANDSSGSTHWITRQSAEQ